MEDMGGYLRIILCRNDILLQLLGREVPVAICGHDSENTMIGDCSVIERR